MGKHGIKNFVLYMICKKKATEFKPLRSTTTFNFFKCRFRQSRTLAQHLNYFQDKIYRYPPTNHSKFLLFLGLFKMEVSCPG